LLRFFFSFNGRLDRSRAWLLLLQLAIAATVIIAAGRGLLWLGFALGTPIALAWAGTANACLITLSVGLYYLSLLSMSVRRLHDRGKSGVWILWALALVMFCCGGIMLIEQSEPQHVPLAAVVLFLLAAGIILRFYIEILGLRGTAGDNLYGADPHRIDRQQSGA